MQSIIINHVIFPVTDNDTCDVKGKNYYFTNTGHFHKPFHKYKKYASQSCKWHFYQMPLRSYIFMRIYTRGQNIPSSQKLSNGCHDSDQIHIIKLRTKGQVLFTGWFSVKNIWMLISFLQNTAEITSGKRKKKTEITHSGRKRIRPARARITASIITIISTKSRRESPAAAKC